MQSKIEKKDKYRVGQRNYLWNSTSFPAFIPPSTRRQHKAGPQSSLQRQWGPVGTGLKAATKSILQHNTTSVHCGNSLGRESLTELYLPNRGQNHNQWSDLGNEKSEEPTKPTAQRFLASKKKKKKKQGSYQQGIRLSPFRLWQR